MAGNGVVSPSAPMLEVDGLSRRLTHPAARIDQQVRDAAGLAARLTRAFRHRLDAGAASVDGLAQRLAWRLAQPLPQAALLPRSALALARSARSRHDHLEFKLVALAQNLAHLDPQKVLERGYAIVSANDGAIVEDASTLTIGDDVNIAFARGNAAAKINEVLSDD